MLVLQCVCERVDCNLRRDCNSFRWMLQGAENVERKKSGLSNMADKGNSKKKSAGDDGLVIVRLDCSDCHAMTIPMNLD